MRTRVLFIGGEKGSWIVRGHQVAAALGARCTVRPKPHDWQWAEVVVLVKRAIVTWGARARAYGRPTVWDVLDLWPQPEDNDLAPATYARWVRRLQRRYRVRTVIGATEAMARSIAGVYLPHHARPGLQATAPRERAQVVAYEGTTKYLGSWHHVLEQACAARGLTFVVNPPDLASADVVVALRGEHWDGALCRAWKSGVKYVNALTAGRPVITQASAAFTEIAPVGRTIERVDELGAALDAVLADDVRAGAYAMAVARAHEFSLSTIARRYRALIDPLARRPT